MEKDHEIVYEDSECLSVLKLKSEKYRVEIRTKDNSALLNSKRFKLFSESQGAESNVSQISSEVICLKQFLCF